MIKKVTQVDSANMKLGNLTKTPEGYLVGMVPIAKVGIYKYSQPDGSIVRQLVNADTLFNTKALETLKLKPITNQHPPEILLDSETVKHRKVGSTGETTSNENNVLLTSLTITDSDAINAAMNGTNGLSPGYTCDLDYTSGTFNGDSYDCIQINREYNHVCICDIPRGGNDIRLPQLDGFTLQDNNIDNLKKGVQMPTINIDSIDYEAVPQVVNHIKKLQAKLDATDAEMLAAEEEKKKMSGTCDALKAKLDGYEKRDINAEIQKAVIERSALITIAKDKAKLDSKECPNMDSMTTQELKIAIIKKLQPNAQLDSQDAVYIDAYYKGTIGSVNFDSTAINNQRVQATPQMDGTAVIDKVEKARLDSEERIKNAWQNVGKV